MKYEWRKKDKELYLPKQKPTILEIPKTNYIMVMGAGHPGGMEFQKNIETLYAMAYGIKMTLKKTKNIAGYEDFTVFPLEGLWDLNDIGREQYQKGVPITKLKEHLTYTLMIRQPDFVTRTFFSQIQEVTSKKKPELNIDFVAYESMEEGLCCQMMHHGSYDTEQESFTIMEAYCTENGYTRISKVHKEIYISDARKVAADRLKTVLRFKIQYT